MAIRFLRLGFISIWCGWIFAERLALLGGDGHLHPT